MGSPRTLTVADALAGALLDAGVRTVTHVPGFGGTAVFAALQRLAPKRWPLSLHEEPAYAVAQGTAFRGRRAAVLVKAHGIAKAANAVLASLSSGTHAGLVVLVFDDPEGRHSDNILDTPALLDGLGIPWERLESARAARGVAEAFARSERVGLPVLLLLDASDCDADAASDDRPEAIPAPPAHARDPLRHIVCPLFTGYQRQVLLARLEGSDPDAVVRPALPRIPDALPAAWQEAIAPYRPFFDAFRALPRTFTTGDTGLSSLFALPPYDCIDLVCYFGGSVPLALGAALAGEGPCWAVTGDFAFAAAGHLGLHEAALRGLPLKVAILDNGRSAATGNQPMPEGALDRALAPFASAVRTVPSTAAPDTLNAVLREANATSALRIVRCSVDPATGAR